MDKEQINKAIAEALGWECVQVWPYAKNGNVPDMVGFHKDVHESENNFPSPDKDSDHKWLSCLPDFAGDLNAIHTAILQLVTSKLQRVEFSERLTAILNRSHDGEHRFIGASPFHHATAEAGELCEALLLQQRLWQPPTGEENE